MSRRPLRLLLLAEDPDQIQLLEEAFRELRELQFTRSWLAPVEFELAETAAEAFEMLSAGGYDAALADLEALAGRGSAFLRRLHDEFPDLPVVFLAAGEQEGEGLSLVRQGAQDCLVKAEIDCVPLVRSLRFAVERARMRAALRSTRLLDELTGLYAERAFFDLAGKFLRIAAWAGAPAEFRLFALQPRRSVASTADSGHPDADLALLSLSEALKEQLGGLEIAGRVSPLEIAMVCLRSGTSSSAAEIAARAAERLTAEADDPRGVAAPARFGIATAVLEPREGTAPAELLAAARSALCENGRAKSAASR